MLASFGVIRARAWQQASSLWRWWGPSSELLQCCLQAGALSDHLLPEVEAGDEDELEDDLVVEQAKHLLPVSARAPTLLRLDEKLARHLNE